MEPDKKIYLLAGLGCRVAIFDKLSFPAGYEPVFVPYIEPQNGESIRHYAARMLATMDTSRPFILLGVSFGGILAQTMAADCPMVEKLILISTVKSPGELPPLYRWTDRLGLLKLAPPIKGYRIKSWLVTGSCDKKHIPLVKHFFEDLSPYYFKWAINQSIKIQNVSVFSNNIDYIHIHGSRDRLFPMERIVGAQEIEGATHLAVYLRGAAVSKLIGQFLQAGNPAQIK